ncbi:MAG: hypothetical protein KF729_23425 [Sandaracinaceae bacterium]|nr:hypothetical protein [Sandaracinaceae bacterium]
MRHHLRLLGSLLVLLGAGASVASAQAEPPAVSGRVVLLAPDAVRAEWTAALQLELAPRDMVVVAAAAPEAATPLLGDAEAQRLALAHGADAAVWVDARGSDFRVRLVGPSDERARVVPLAGGADPRTVALIVVSLLDGALPAPVVVVAPATEPAAAPTASGALGAPAEEHAAPARAPEGPRARWSGRLGLATFGLFDGNLSPGGAVRGGISMRYAWFEASILHDLGFYAENSPAGGGGVQVVGRTCLELGAATAREYVGFHGGVRGCAGSRGVSEVQTFFPGGEVFFSSGPRVQVSAGTYLALALPVEGWLRLFLRTDVDIGWTDLALGDAFDVTPTFSVLASFE